MSTCCSQKNNPPDSTHCDSDSVADIKVSAEFPMVNNGQGTCCGGDAPAPDNNPHEKPGYRLWGFVRDFRATKAGPVPLVRTRLNRQDKMGTLRVRLGIGRDNYPVAPGIYAVGMPDDQSPVMVTANFKLSFDVLRRSLTGINAWILVVDTRSINVWCAAGKGTFSTDEVAMRVKEANLEQLVSHRKLILPQLAATGVCARQVKKSCGFEVIWGPVHAKDIGDFLDGGMKTTPAMRQITFSLKERVELIPVELTSMGKPSLYLVPALFVLSGLGSGLFSLNAAISRGITAFVAYLLALFAGAFLTPILLPRLPGRTFAAKGAVVGAVTGILLSAGMFGRLAVLEMFALILFIMSISSCLSMNFTGSTPFTSPTGVEKEMRRAMPVQGAALVVAVVLWVVAGYMRG